MTPDVRFNTFLRRYYALRFLGDFALVYPVYAVYFVRAGLSVYEISLLFAWWSATVLVLEVPSGALADRWDRRWMLVIAMLAKAMCFAVWLGASGMTMFAVGFLLWGVSSSFLSGTLESLVYDILDRSRSTDRYEEIAGRGSFYSKVAIAAAFVLGGAVAAVSFSVVLLFSVLAMLVAACMAWGMREMTETKTSSRELPYREVLGAALAEAAASGALRRILTYSMVALGVYGMLEEYDQLYREWVGMPLVYFGLWSAALMGGQAAAARWAYRFGGREHPQVKYLCALLAGAAILVAVAAPSLYVLPVYALGFCAMAVAEVLVEAELQRSIRTNQRATLISLNSLMLHIGGIVLALLFGVLAAVGGLQLGLAAYGALLIAAGATGMLARLDVLLRRMLTGLVHPD